MHRIRHVYLSFVIVFSELIWSYYTIALFTSIEWNKPAFFDLKWFFMAMLSGYILNILLTNMKKHGLIFLVNTLTMAILIIQNWRSTVPSGHLGFGIAVSMGIFLVFLRSLVSIYSFPTRIKLLQHFEINIILYIIFAAIFTYHDYAYGIFHIFFILAILNSLLGIVITLQNIEMSEKVKGVKVVKVGHSAWFTGIAIGLFIIIPLLSLIFLLPSISEGLHSIIIGLWNGLKNIGLLIGKLIYWIFSLLPEPQIAPLPDMPGQQGPIVSEKVAGNFIPLPYVWFLGALAILSVLIALWVLSKIMLEKRPINRIKTQDIMISHKSWIKILLKRLIGYLKGLKLKFMLLFPRYYINPIYWYYRQVLNWGKKNKIPKNPWETSKEYFIKVIAKFPQDKKSFAFRNNIYDFEKLMVKLNEDYQASYYGNKNYICKKSIPEYEILIDYMRQVKI